MKPSQLQVNRVIFNKVEIEPVYSPFRDDNPESAIHFENLDISNFDFDGVCFNITVDIGIAEGQEDNPIDYFVELKFGIQNLTGKICPYKINIDVAGIIKASQKIPLKVRDNMVIVNGSSVLMGAIREMVTNITGRSVFGAITLPTANFTDYAQPETEELNRPDFIGGLFA